VTTPGALLALTVKRSKFDAGWLHRRYWLIRVLEIAWTARDGSLKPLFDKNTPATRYGSVAPQSSRITPGFIEALMFPWVDGVGVFESGVG